MARDFIVKLKSQLKLRRNLRHILPVLDLLSAVPTGMAGAYLFVLKRLGLNEMPLNKWALEQVGIWPVRRHYYEPYFDRHMLRRPLDQPRDLPGVDLNTGKTLGLFSQLAVYGKEPLIGPADDEHGYRPDNGTYGLPDAALLYALIRHLKPRKLIEIGSGNSTLVTMKALAKNRQEGRSCEHL
jgi:hypothetical protein